MQSVEFMHSTWSPQQYDITTWLTVKHTSTIVTYDSSTIIPVIVMLCRFPDPIGVVVFSATDSDVMFIMELLVRFCKA